MNNFNDFSKWISLMEMPITNLNLIGQWGPNAKRAYGFDKQDIGILESPRGAEKIKKKWSNTVQEFDFYFIRSAKARLKREVGEVTPDWLKQNLDLDIQPRKNAITVVFTQNSAAEKIPMTAWTIAHRLGHALRRESTFLNYFFNEIIRDFKELAREVYGFSISSSNKYAWSSIYINRDEEKLLKSIAENVGTMKSVRENKLRNFYEFIYELVAQYIITGNIVFKPLPKSFILKKRFIWGRPTYQLAHSNFVDDEMSHEEWNQTLQSNAKKYENYLNNTFNSIVGKVFVM